MNKKSFLSHLKLAVFLVGFCFFFSFGNVFAGCCNADGDCGPEGCAKSCPPGSCPGKDGDCKEGDPGGDEDCLNKGFAGVCGTKPPCYCDRKFCGGGGCDPSDPAAPACGASPPNGSEITAFGTTLEWTGTSNWGKGCPTNSNRYKVYFREQGTAANWGGTKVCEVGSGTTSCDVGGLELCKTYEWKVRADNGSRHKDSGICSFSVNCDREPPTGDVAIEWPVCPHIESPPVPDFSSVSHYGSTTLTASNVQDNAGGWGIDYVEYMVWLVDTIASWGPFDHPEAGGGWYTLGQRFLVDFTGGPNSDTFDWGNSTSWNSTPRHLEDLDYGLYTVGLNVVDRAGNGSTPPSEAEVEIKCPGFIEGYVWEEDEDNAVDGVDAPDPAELLSTGARIYLEDRGVVPLPTAPTEIAYDGLSGFRVAVEAGADHEFRVYIVPDGCYCPTADCPGLFWNDGGGAVSYGSESFVGYPAAGTPFAAVTPDPADPLDPLEVRYAYLGVQEANFVITGPSSFTIDPGGEVKTIVASICKKHDYCWAPSDGEVLVSVSPVVSADGLVAVDSISPPAVNPFSGCVTSSIVFQADPSAAGNNYNFTVTGTGPCGQADFFEADVDIEHWSWFQSEVGDVYAGADVTSYIPPTSPPALPESAVSCFSDNQRFLDLGPPYNYFSMANAGPGLILSGGVLEWGDGFASVRGWEDGGYEIGFYDYDGGSCDYDFGYFDANLEPDCELDADAVMGDGVLALVSDSSTTCSAASNNVIRIDGELSVENGDDFENGTAAILVDGSVTFSGTWEMTEHRPEPDIMLVMDRSGSMGGGKLEDAKDALHTFLDNCEGAPDKDKVGLAFYDDHYRVYTDLTYNLGENRDSDVPIRNEINGIGLGNWTSIGGGLYVAVEEFQSARVRLPVEEHPQYIILATDGHQNTCPAPYIPGGVSGAPPFDDGYSCGDDNSAGGVDYGDIVQRAKREGIVVFTIGIGGGAEIKKPGETKDKALDFIASQTGGKAYYAPNSASLASLYADIAAEITEVEITGGFAPLGGCYAFISSGDIRIGSGVSTIQSPLIADGTIFDFNPDEDDETVYENQAYGLWVHGSSAGCNYDLRRTRVGPDRAPNTLDDDLAPANYFSLDPHKLVCLVDILGIPRYTWEEEQ